MVEAAMLSKVIEFLCLEPKEKCSPVVIRYLTFYTCLRDPLHQMSLRHLALLRRVPSFTSAEERYFLSDRRKLSNVH